MSDDSDPYEALPDEEYVAKGELALGSTQVQFVRSLIVDHLREVVEDDVDNDMYTRGYRHALRMVYLMAGGEVDGSEAQWATVERRPGG